MQKNILFGVAAFALVGTGIAVAHPFGGKDADTNNDGTVSKTEMLSHADQMFTTMDANADGKIDSNDREMRKGARHAEHFAELDADKSGGVTPAEMDAFHAQRMAEMQAKHAERQAAMFAEFDSNKDGALSAAEMAAARPMRGPDGDGPDGDGPDGDGPGRGWGERGDGPGKHGGHHGGKHHRGGKGGGKGDMLMIADANKDGAVTKAEFIAARTAHFNTADSNKDGSISAAEHDAMRAARKAAKAAAQ